MNKLIKFSLFLICNILFLLILTCCNSSKLQRMTLTLFRQDDNSQQNIDCELALTEEERSFGFMERKIIPDGTGMLFVYTRDQILRFYMKNTPHPLSIAFIDSKGIIRDIFDMTPYSLATISSTVSVRYALEVPQGWFNRANIKIGDKLEIPQNFN